MKEFIFEGYEIGGTIVGKVRLKKEEPISEQSAPHTPLTDIELRSVILGSFEDFREVRKTAFEMVGIKQESPPKEKVDDSDHDAIMSMSLK